MGYGVYITRARHHLEGSQVPIPQSDWRTIIENDPGLTASAGQPDLARWAGPSAVDDPRIDWVHGNLFSRDPDHSVLRKLVDIAGLLGGRVQGDDGELYFVERGQVVRADLPAEPAETPDRLPPAPFQGVEAVAEDLDPGMGEEDLEAALGALASYNAAVFEAAPGAPVHEDPNASFARPPDEALEHDQHTTPPRVPFRVGQRVRTPWGRPGTIVSIDPDADWGMGHIEIKYDDGRTATTSCIAHGLAPM
jgi:hypothetical protein